MRLIYIVFFSIYSQFALADYSGWYVGRDINTFTNQGFALNARPDADNTEQRPGYGLFGGYRFNEIFALEGGFTRFGDSLATDQSASHTLTQSYRLQAAGILPVIYDISLIGKLGARYHHPQDSTDIGLDSAMNDNLYDLGMSMGVGVHYPLTYDLGVRVELERMEGFALEDDNFLSLGLSYGF